MTSIVMISIKLGDSNKLSGLPDFKPIVETMKTITASLALVLLSGCISATPDSTGQLPADVARGFIAAVQVDDYDKAASFFTKRSVNAIQHNSAQEYSVKKYCAHFKDLDSYELSTARRGKADYWHLMMSGRRGGKEVRYRFYFEKVGDKWLLTKSENFYFWDQATPDEPHACLKIKTFRYKNDRVDFPPDAGPDDITVLVHRIGHERAMPADPLFAESDGSFHCRIRPGSYQIEYEVFKGKRESQQITYPVTTQVFEAGQTYILNGYSITVNNTK